MAEPQQLPCPPFWVEQTEIDCLCPDLANVAGPCVPDPVPAAYPFTDAEFRQMASHVLFERTCRRFPGVCPVELRPCDPCRNCKGCCECRYTYIPLAGPYPVIEVTEVKIDGVVLAPTSYRVDEFIRLVRTDGERWPRWQDLNADPDVAGGRTLVIRYTTGRSVPLDLRYAAALLTCELKRACNGQGCQLPDNVTSLTRDGVSLDLVDPSEIFTNGSFGVPLIDQLLATYQCKGYTTQLTSRIMHPLMDGERYDRSGVRS